MNERVSKILNNPLRVPISIGVVAFGAGVGLGYILGRRNRIEVHEIPDQLEIDFNVDELLQLKNKETTVIPAKKVTNIPEYKKVDGRYVKVIEEEDILPKENNELDDSILRHPAAAVDDGKTFVANKIKEAMTTTKETAASTKEVVEDVLDEVVTHSIFANDDDDWNYAREVKKELQQSLTSFIKMSSIPTRKVIFKALLFIIPETTSYVMKMIHPCIIMIE